jgi:hypothetical protein
MIVIGIGIIQQQQLFSFLMMPSKIFEEKLTMNGKEKLSRVDP